MDTDRQGLVVKSNRLINAMVDLTLQGNRFLAFAVSLLDRSVDPKPDQFVTLEIPVKEFAEAFDIPTKYAYNAVEELADQLQRKIIQLGPDETGDGRRVKVGVISRQEYLDSEGRVWISFDPYLIPHLLGLKDHFTQYRIKDIYQFASVHSWRLYELLRQHKGIGKRDFSIDELRYKMGLTGLYARVGNLKSRVVDPAVREINIYSDIVADYSQKKRGRRIVGLTFIIRENTQTRTPTEKVRATLNRASSGSPCLSPDLARLLREDYGVGPKQAKQLADLASGVEDSVQELLPKIRERWEALPDKRTSLGGYCFKALKAELVDHRRSRLIE